MPSESDQDFLKRMAQEIKSYGRHVYVHADIERLLRIAQEAASLRAAVGVAYQFCAARGANDKLLDNLSALASGDPVPHSDWPPKTGLWKWEKCGHLADTACEQCLQEADEDRKRLDGLQLLGSTGVALVAKDMESETLREAIDKVLEP